MGNIISFLKWLLNSFALIIVTLFFAWCFRNHPVLKNSILITVGLFIILFYISPLTNVVAEFWEREYPAFDLKQHSGYVKKNNVDIVVLGSGYSNDPELSITSQLSTETALRLMEAVRIYHEIGNAKIVTSGASLWQNKPQAQAVAEAAVSLGVSPNDTFYLTQTRFTQDEAADFVKRFGKKDSVILVTEAMHMRRAMFWFNNYGIKIIPAPCNYYYKKGQRRKMYDWFPSYKKIDTIDRFIKELAGLAWAKLIT